VGPEPFFFNEKVLVVRVEPPTFLPEDPDFYDVVVERHRRAATAFTSNRDTSEWLAVMADPLLAQSAIDRVTSAVWELVIEGESYRKREKPTLDPPPGEDRPSRRGHRRT